jgi:hypothetical protein
MKTAELFREILTNWKQAEVDARAAFPKASAEEIQFVATRAMNRSLGLPISIRRIVCKQVGQYWIAYAGRQAIWEAVSRNQLTWDLDARGYEMGELEFVRTEIVVVR